MAKGNRVNDGEILEAFSTKLEPGTKQKLEALVKVQHLGGQRELINRMLEGYADKYPEDMEKVAQLLELLGTPPAKIY